MTDLPTDDHDASRGGGGGTVAPSAVVEKKGQAEPTRLRDQFNRDQADEAYIQWVLAIEQGQPDLQKSPPMTRQGLLVVWPNST